MANLAHATAATYATTDVPPIDRTPNWAELGGGAGGPRNPSLDGRCRRRGIGSR